MRNTTSADLGSEASHDERDIRSVGGQNSDTRPIDIELADEAKGSEVINRKSNSNRPLFLLKVSTVYHHLFHACLKTLKTSCFIKLSATVNMSFNRF